MFYNQTFSEVLEFLKSSERGLTQEEAEKRLKDCGLNELPEAKPDSLFIIFIRQFQSPLIYILFGAALIVFYLGEMIDGSIILAVLLFNAFVGMLQEGKAQNTLSALKKFVETKALILRDGKEIIISDSRIAPGDIILLQEGEKAPADARVIVSNNLKIDQAALTGESEPVFKTVEPIHQKDMPFIDQKNMVFKGTYIVSGNGQAVAVNTGVNTIIGKIGQKIALIDTEIPLKKDIRQLSRLIIFTVALISVILFAVGIFFGKSLIEMFKVVVALSVSIIPEGLPVVITLVLATGVWRMAKRNALVKRLQAVEALGQTKIIALDKTGTITKNELAIQKVFINGKFFEIGGVGYEPKGDIYYIPDAKQRIDANAANENKEKQLISPPDFEELILAGKIAAFCSNAYVFYSEEDKNYKISGDPTEAAILVFSQKIGFQKEIIEKQHPLIEEIPFDYKNKYRFTLRQSDANKFASIIGAPESVLSLCKLAKKEKENLENIFYKMSAEGLRVLAFAYKEAGPKIKIEPEKTKFVFAGFYGMRDGLREEAKEAIKQAQEAGIRIIMITGDHKITAQAIAKEAGIFKEGDEILTGKDLEEISEEELILKLPKVSVFARVTPEHKLRIIEAYRKRKEIIAMTGDGVNDAPSLVAADLGVAMGKIGTEVAKEASDIILLDDNFGTIISAIEEGRSIYKTIKKVIVYLFSTSLGEVLTISIALFSGYPLPLLAGQIIWLNFITDGFLVVALGMEPKEKGLLHLKFKKPARYLVDSLMVQRMAVMALPMSIGSFFIFQKYLDFDLTKALTMCLTTLAIFQWFNAFNCRSENKSIFRMNFFSNKWLLAAAFIVVFLQLMAVYNPIMQKILRTTALEFSDWLIAIAIAFSIIIIEEFRKVVYRKFAKS
ncbi:MAG: HAD-IC family P-type ATPase [bacterium]|nr:HAD-IC family P-type ATPase [bacterium]